MTTEILDQWPRWRDKLLLTLRLEDVPGHDIGDILTEIAAHVAETGESPEDAFGDAAAYARARAAAIARPHHPYLGMSLGSTLAYIASGVGGFMSASGAWAVGAGDDGWGPLPAWLTLLIGLVLLFGPLRLLPSDLVTDPRTGRPLFGSRETFHRIAAGFGLGSLLLLALAGWWIAN